MSNSLHQTVWLLGGAGRTRECRPNCLSNCLVTIFSTRTGSAQVKLCIKQFGYWVELVVPGSAGQTVCQTVWSQSSQHGQALLRSNCASNSLVTGWSWSYQGVPAKPFVKLFGHNLLNTDRLCSGQTMHQTVWLLGGAGRTRECRPNRLSNCLVTIFSTRTGSAQVKLCIKQFGYWVELVVPGSAGQIVCQTVWSQSSQHGQALLRSNYASNSLVTGWSWSYQGVPAKPFVKLFGHNLLNTDRLCSGQTMHQTVWLLGGAGRTRECRPNCLSNCLVTIFSTRTGSAQVKLCIKQFGYWVELVVPESAGQIVCQTVWSQSSQHGQALLRSNCASNSLVTGWSWSYQGVPAKLFVKLFGHNLLNTDRLCSGQTMHQTVWLLGGAGRTRECRPNRLSNCLVTIFSTRTGSAQVKLCIKQFGYWVELVVPESAGQTVCQTVWSQSSQHGQALLRSNYASNSLVTGWSWSYQRVPAKLFVKLFGHNLLNTDRLCSGQTVHQTVWLLGGAGRTRECRPNRLSNCLVTIFSTRTGSAQVKLCIKQFGYWVELVVPGSAGQTVCQTVWSQSSQHGQALLRSNYASNSLVTGWSWSYQRVPAKLFVKLFGHNLLNTDRRCSGQTVHQTVWLLGGAGRTRECRPNRLSNCLVTVFSTRITICYTSLAGITWVCDISGAVVRT